MHELSIRQGIVESVCDAAPDGQVLAVKNEIGRLKARRGLLTRDDVVADLLTRAVP